MRSRYGELSDLVVSQSGGLVGVRRDPGHIYVGSEPFGLRWRDRSRSGLCGSWRFVERGVDR